MPAEEVLAVARETGDLGLAAERLLAAVGERREATLEVEAVFAGLHQVAQARASSVARKLAGLVGLLERATPLEARYLLRTVTANLRLGINFLPHPGRPGRGPRRRPQAAAGLGGPTTSAPT